MMNDDVPTGMGDSEPDPPVGVPAFEVGPSSPVAPPPMLPPISTPLPPAGSVPPVGYPQGEGTAPPYSVPTLADPAVESVEVSSGSRALGRVGVVGAAVLLFGGVVFAVSSLSSSGGSESPEAAVDKLFQSASDEDAIGVLETLAPGERDAILPGVEGMVAELERLEILSPVDLRDVGGFDVEFSDYELVADPVADHIVTVEVVGGTVDGSTVPDEVPVGDQLRSLVEDDLDGDLTVEETSSSESMDDTRITTVKVDGRWYVSIGYSIAEAARTDAGEPVPDFSDPITAIGADTPEGAVDGLFASISDLDLRDMIGMLPPDEMMALYDYAPMFVDDAQSDIDESRDEDDFEFSVDGLAYSVSGSGSTRRVVIDSFEFTGGDEYSNVRVSWADRCAEVEETYTSEWEADEEDEPEVVRWCADGEVTVNGQPWDEYYEELYEDDPYYDEEFMSPDFPEVDFGGEAVLALTVVKVDGRWYVSPTRSTFDLLLEGLRALEVEDLETMGDWFSEGFLFGTTEERFVDVGCAIDGEGNAYEECEVPTFDDNTFDDLDESYFEAMASCRQEAYDESLSTTYEVPRSTYLESQVVESCLEDLIDSGELPEYPTEGLDNEPCFASYDELASDASEDEWLVADEKVLACMAEDDPSILIEPCFDEAYEQLGFDLDMSSQRLNYLLDAYVQECAEALLESGAISEIPEWYVFDEPCSETYDALAADATEEEWLIADEEVLACLAEDDPSVLIEPCFDDAYSEIGFDTEWPRSAYLVDTYVLECAEELLADGAISEIPDWYIVDDPCYSFYEELASDATEADWEDADAEVEECFDYQYEEDGYFSEVGSAVN